MNKKTRIYAIAAILAVVGGLFTWLASPSRADVTSGSDGSLYLYDGNYALQEAADKTWDFAGEVYASASSTTAEEPFVCPAESTGAYTFIADRGQERGGLNSWNAAATQIFPAGSKNLLEPNFTPSANIISLKLPQSSIKQVGGDYSLGIACTGNNGVTVIKTWYRYISVTAGTGVWTALANGDGSGGTGGGTGGNGGGTGGNGGGGSTQPTLGAGTTGLTLNPVVAPDWAKNRFTTT